MKEMAANNRLWGAERMRGELLKLDIRVCKRTISEGYEARSHHTAERTELENVPAQSCSRDMGL